MRALKLDSYVIDTLMPDLVGHDRRPGTFVVYLLLWRRTHGVGEKSATIALEDLAELSGLSKRTVQESLRWLQSRRLLSVKREGPTGVGRFVVLEPWKRG